MRETNQNNHNLHKAKQEKNDEFYTRYEDIEAEIQHYTEHFENKTVFCNCDDPHKSNFLSFFMNNFNQLKLKKLIVTGCKDASALENQISLFSEEETVIPKAEAIIIQNVPQNAKMSLDDLLQIKGNSCQILKGNNIYLAGDFRSDESLAFLRESDIIVTNPPFSLFRDFIALLMKEKKKFLVIGNKNAITYREFFPLLINNEVWLGYNAVKGFLENGTIFRAFGNIGWFTNLDMPKRHEKLSLLCHYNPQNYPKYDTCDAINIDKTSEIPCDFWGIMGVPISFLDHYNGEQFEIVGKINHGPPEPYDIAVPIVNGKVLFKRIAVKLKHI